MAGKELEKHRQTRVEAFALRDEMVWQTLSEVSLLQAAEQFVMTLQGQTKRAYKAALQAIFHCFKTHRLFSPENSLQTFSLSNPEFLLDEIRSKLPGSDATKQARSAAFISLTRYLQRATGGMVRCVLVRKDKTNPTFRPIRETSLTTSLKQADWVKFLIALNGICFRDYLVAKTMLQGAKRVSEVIEAQIERIDWEHNRISFKQLKSRQIEKFTIITYPISFIEELRGYLAGRTAGPIFITKTGKPLSQAHIYRSFAKASRKGGLSTNVHPHMLRASAITYLSSQGFHSDEIMRVSGHADAKLIRYYDKTPLEKNPTQNVNLI